MCSWGDQHMILSASLSLSSITDYLCSWDDQQTIYWCKFWNIYMWSAHNHYWPSEGGKGVWFDSESSMFNALQFSKETGDKCIALTTTIDWQQISSSSSSMSSSSPLSSSSSTTSSALSWCLSSLSVSLAFNCYGLYLIISWTWRQMHCHTVFLWTFHDLEIFHKKV